jgi:ankyrin repeat protein
MMRAFMLLTVAALSGAAGCAWFWEMPGTELGRAAHRGDIPAIRELIAGGANPNEFDITGQTALHWAARGGHPFGPHDCQGEARGRDEVIAVLVAGRADLNLPDRRGEIPGAASGWTPLHVALHHQQFATAARMLALGADPNIRSHQGKTVLSVATDQDAPAELLRAIVDQGSGIRDQHRLLPGP